MKKTCKNCGKSWDARVANPAKCLHCQSRNWNKKKIRRGMVGRG